MNKEIIEIMKKAERAGKIIGEFNEAHKSLKRRFTDNELNEIVNIVWFSPQLQSIRNRLDAVEKKVNNASSKK